MTYSNEYIVVKRRIGVAGTDNAAIINKNLTFKNNASLKLWLSKINNAFIDNTEDLGIVMPMYNLLKYSKKYSANDAANENNDTANYRINNNKTTLSKSFDKNNKKETANNNTLDTGIFVPLNYLGNF